MRRIVLSFVAVSCSLLAQTGNLVSPETNPFGGRSGALTARSIGFRFIGVTSNFKGIDAFNQARRQAVPGGALRFDREAKCTLQTLPASGVPFNAGWNNTDAFIHGNRPYAGGEFQIGHGLGIFALCRQIGERRGGLQPARKTSDSSGFH